MNILQYQKGLITGTFIRFEIACRKATEAINNLVVGIEDIAFKAYCQRNGKLPISRKELCKWYVKYLKSKPMEIEEYQ